MIVQVQQGKLEGIEKKSLLSGKPFWAFTGIPYAKPPVGDLRFKPPVPIDKWDGVLDATKEGDDCMQWELAFGKSKIIGTENCLYLNVYTPETPSDIKDKKAVMVYIHGGGFHSGSGSARLYGPDFLVSHDVIYVTLNYRLHIFGFLNTGTSNCPGNAGLKDQLLALKWVKQNIINFGGDPENITLFGESAGAAAVHLLMLSPLTKGLFKKTILQSGSALSPWAIEAEPEAQARKAAKLTGFDGDDLEGLVEHLKSVPAEKLCEIAQSCHEDAKHTTPGICATVTFIPSVEKIKEDALVPDYPENLTEAAELFPSIIGFTDKEGILVFLSQAPHYIGLLMEDLSIAVKNNFHLDDSKQAELVAKIKEFYFNNKKLTPQSLEQIIDLYTDLYFLKFFEAFDYLIQSDVPPYLYSFTYEGNLNVIKGICRQFVKLDMKGAAHGDDLGYLFSQQLPVDIKPSETDKEVINNCCTLWTNFAKNGQPTSSIPQVDWKPNTISHPSYLKIDKTLEVVNEKLLPERFDFWKTWTAQFRR